MGSWGNKLYENDLSLDIKARFEEMYHSGKTIQEITDLLMDEYRDVMGVRDEEACFWITLADVQWNNGLLLPQIKEEALFRLRKELSNDQALDAQTAAQRKRVLAQLQRKLLSPPPAAKKAVKKRAYVCSWRIGDVYAFRLESDFAKEKNLYGRYFLIQKIDEAWWHPGHTVPIVYIKISDGERLPATVGEYDRLEHVQIWSTKYEERFFPIDMSRPQEDIAEKSQKSYKTDEYGRLPQYRGFLLNTSKRIIPTKLIYVGNFASASAPTIEFVPHVNTNMVVISWGKNGEAFEGKMIRAYCGHNQRELGIYNS